MIRYASVCSGVEAASLAWEPLGWKPVWFSETEPFPCEVLRHRFPGVPNLGDMAKIKGEEYAGNVDLLVGGTPCQDLSVAGKRAGLAGERSSLALNFVELAYRMECKWFAWENVPGCLSSGTSKGTDFATLLSMFTGRDIEPPKNGWGNAGYIPNDRPDRFGIAWRTLDAQFTRTSEFPFAVPQRRRRVFLVGYFGDWTRAAEVLLEPGRLQWDTPARIKTRERVTETVGTDTALADGALRGTGGGSTECLSIGNGQADGLTNPPELAQTLNCMHDQQAVLCYENHANDSRITESNDVSPLISSRAGTGGGNLPLVQECFVKTARPTFKGGAEKYADTGVAPTVNTFDQGDKRSNELVCESICFAIDSVHSNSMKSANPNSGFHKEEIAKTLDTTDPNPTKNQGGNVIVSSINCQGGSNINVNNDITDTLTAATNSSGNNLTAVAIAENIIGRQVQNGGNGAGAQEKLACTQNTSGVMDVCQSTVRRLLPIECERLMGFPDNWTRIPWKGKPAEECPDSPRYKACGNSMCVNVMQWIGEQIQKVEDRHND